MTESEIAGQNALMDAVMIEQQLKNDASLSRWLEVAPPVISKIRGGKLPVGCSLILRIHETVGMPVVLIRRILAGAA